MTQKPKQRKYSFLLILIAAAVFWPAAVYMIFDQGEI